MPTARRPLRVHGPLLQGISEGCRGSIREGWHRFCSGNLRSKNGWDDPPSIFVVDGKIGTMPNFLLKLVGWHFFCSGRLAK